MNITVITGNFSVTEVARADSVICTLPSPAISITGKSGLANFAPTAAGNPQPIVPNPVDVKKVPGSATSKCNDAHI